jgi:hypothetical protein
VTAASAKAHNAWGIQSVCTGTSAMNGVSR